MRLKPSLKPFLVWLAVFYAAWGTIVVSGEESLTVSLNNTFPGVSGILVHEIGAVGIPTLSPLGLAILGLLMVLGAAFGHRRLRNQ